MIDIALYLRGFLEGLAITLSPCILPILPLILSASVSEEKNRPYGVILGFILSFSLFTLLSHWLLEALGLDPGIIQTVVYVLFFLFGLTLLFEGLSDKFSAQSQWFTKPGQWFQGLSNNLKGFTGGLVLGVGLGFIWVPCAGPLLAIVLVDAATQQTSVATVALLLSFAVGAGLPMLIISLFGNRLVQQLTWLKERSVLIRRLTGALIISVIGLTLWVGPSFFAGLGLSTPEVEAQASPTQLKSPLARTYKAPDIQGVNHWLNSKPLTMNDLKGKVVLVDFWTYSCINCVRTLPHLKEWHAKYADKGLVILGVHAPEFAFERSLNNVSAAVKKFGLQYPIALDNGFKTWRAFNNHYWPAHYLIDKEGNVVYEHFGEGAYDTTEHNIRTLLGLDKMSADKSNQKSVNDLLSRVRQTPETYLGTLRAARYSGSPQLANQQQEQFKTNDSSLPVHHWQLEGRWKSQPEFIESKAANSQLELKFHAKKVFLVLGSADGQPIPVTIQVNQGEAKTLTIQEETLYELLEQAQAEEGLLTLTAHKPGLKAYAFTFES